MVASEPTRLPVTLAGEQYETLPSAAEYDALAAVPLNQACAPC